MKKERIVQTWHLSIYYLSKFSAKPIVGFGYSEKKEKKSCQPNYWMLGMDLYYIQDFSL